MTKALKDYYEDGLDELLMLHNPSGGRPQKIGSYVPTDPDGVHSWDVSQIREEVCHRFVLGYCYCGRKVLIGPKRAEMLAAAFEKWHIHANVPKAEKVPLRLRFARWLAAPMGKGIEKVEKTA